MAYINGKKVISKVLTQSVAVKEPAIKGVTLETIDGDPHLIINSDMETPYIIVESTRTVRVNGSNSTVPIAGKETQLLVIGSGSVTAHYLEPQNIKKGVTILGVTGTYEG